MEPSEAIEAIKSNYPPERYSILREALDLSMELLDKKEKGLIIELPVPMGTEVWTCYDYDDGRGIVVKKDSMFSINCLSIAAAWGNRVFATREEAEAKLKEMKEDEDDKL